MQKIWDFPEISRDGGNLTVKNCWQAELLYNSYKHSVVKHKSVDGTGKYEYNVQ